MATERDISEIQQALTICWVLAQRNGFHDLIKTLDAAIDQAQQAADRLLAPPPTLAPNES